MFGKFPFSALYLVYYIQYYLPMLETLLTRVSIGKGGILGEMCVCLSGSTLSILSKIFAEN